MVCEDEMRRRGRLRVITRRHVCAVLTVGVVDERPVYIELHLVFVLVPGEILP